MKNSIILLISLLSINVVDAYSLNFIAGVGVNRKKFTAHSGFELNIGSNNIYGTNYINTHTYESIGIDYGYFAFSTYDDYYKNGEYHSPTLIIIPTIGLSVDNFKETKYLILNMGGYWFFQKNQPIGWYGFIKNKISFNSSLYEKNISIGIGISLRLKNE